MLLRLSGHDVTYDQTREAVAVGPKGTSLLELRQAASRLGAETTVSRCSMAELVQMPKPVIAYLRLEPPGTGDRPGHYVVVLAADETGVEVIDGTLADSVTYGPPVFEAVWSGHILAPAPPQTWLRALALTVVGGVWVGIGLAWWRVRVLRSARAPHALVALAQAEGARP